MKTRNNENEKWKKWREGYAAGFIAAHKKYNTIIKTEQKKNKELKKMFHNGE